MYLAHLPAGYLTIRLFQGAVKRIYPDYIPKRSHLAAGLVASILPDFDMLYSHLFDTMHRLHHTYVTHIPFFWVALFTGIISLSVAAGKRRVALVMGIIALNIMMHLVLDTVSGDIHWLSPFSDSSYFLFKVTFYRRPFFLNLLQPALIAEYSIFMLAAILFIYEKKRRKWMRGRLSSPAPSNP